MHTLSGLLICQMAHCNQQSVFLMAAEKDKLCWWGVRVGAGGGGHIPSSGVLSSAQQSQFRGALGAAMSQLLGTAQAQGTDSWFSQPTRLI